MHAKYMKPIVTDLLFPILLWLTQSVTASFHIPCKAPRFRSGTGKD